MWTRKAIFSSSVVVSTVWSVLLTAGAAPSGGPQASTLPSATSPATGPATSRVAKGIELARPGTLQEYIDRYRGSDAGCTIGGQTFRNFKLQVISSILESELNGQPHPAFRMTPEQITLTPVNYVKDGRRWVGFRFTNTKDGLEILGGPKLPKDYKHAQGHDVQNCGFQTLHDIRMEVHGTVKWERAKAAYAGLATETLVDGKWNEAACVGPGARGNIGWLPGMLNAIGSYDGINPKTPSAGGWARLCSVSRGFKEEAKAPCANENWFEFLPDKAPTAFEVRANRIPNQPPNTSMYGINNRINCWDQTNTRWRVDYLEYSFTNSAVTDEIWTADGKNKAAPAAKLPQADAAAFGDLPAAKPSGETMDLADGVKMKLVLIPAGKFIMGSPNDEPGRCDNEGPQRVVTISKPFYMGVFEVTQDQYKAVMGKPAQARSPNHPAEQINWSEADAFCKALSKKTGKAVRLPTEAQWEYACRAGTTTRFPFGNDDKDLGDYAWFLKNFKKIAKAGHDGNPCPPGEKKPNAWGLYDMNGNVWEWCSDWYADSYVEGEATDPHGPKIGQAHVLRGGSWGCPAAECRSASRWIGSYGDIQDTGTIGFRVVCEAESK